MHLNININISQYFGIISINCPSKRLLNNVLLINKWTDYLFHLQQIQLICAPSECWQMYFSVPQVFKLFGGLVRHMPSNVDCWVLHCVINISISICTRSKNPAKSQAQIKPHLTKNTTSLRGKCTQTKMQLIQKVMQHCTKLMKWRLQQAILSGVSQHWNGGLQM